MIGAGNPDYKGKDWADVWAESPEKQARSEEIAELISKRSKVELSKTLKDDREYAMPLAAQMKAVLHRQFVAFWRMPEYMTGKFIIHIVRGIRGYLRDFL